MVDQDFDIDFPSFCPKWKINHLDIKTFRHITVSLSS